MAKQIVISIVDDDQSVREAMTSLMKSHGFSAEVFHSPESFLKSDRSDGTDCLIADLQMPGMTGFELHDRLVRSGKRIPTILITGYPSVRVQMRALEVRIMCYLTKPFEEDALLECIRLALKYRHPGGSKT